MNSINRNHTRLLLSAVGVVLIGLMSIAPALAQRDDDPCASPANPTVAENCKAGDEGWLITNWLEDIEGFAYPPSVAKGETVDIFVNTTAPNFDLFVYRSGYYGGAGGRLVETVEGVEGTAQPACNADLPTGLTSCANWQVSHSLTVPEDWVSGVYTAKLVRPDTGGEGYALFVVRDDERDSDILYQQSLFTYHAYDNYGGKSIYTFNSGFCNTVSGAPRGVKVSLYRPYNGGTSAEANDLNNYFRVEYPMVRWLEAQGYDVTYSTDLDTHRSGVAGAHNELLDHPMFLVSGHDEYWTQEMRDAVTAARDAGVHLGFFGANILYWRVRLEPDPWTGEPDSVIVNYKTTEAGVPDPSGHHTATWRDSATINDPENSLLGLMYVGDNDRYYFPVRVTAEQGKHDVYRHTDLQSMPEGTYINFGDQVIGWEWDAVQDNGHTPEGIEILAASPTFGVKLNDEGNFYSAGTGFTTANVARYVAPSGAIVFASGAIQWSWGLGAHGPAVVETDPYIQQITYNVLADMGVQPASPTEDVILDGEDGMVTSPAEAFLPQEVEDAPVITNIEIWTESGDYGMMPGFSWETNVEATGEIWLGEKEGHVIDPGSFHDDYTLQHEVFDEDFALYPGRTYYYKLMSVDPRGHIAVTEEGSFVAGGSLPLQGRFLLRDVFRSVRCWVEMNPILAIVIGVVIALVVLFVIWRVFVYIRNRRTVKESA
ncbi:MAG: hypothetical protein JXB47_01450 [Anaerolineae bacterium]|nr:hypothetical protein [Anaerolineae bacterium]